ncbi:MAG: anti-sigma factor family protein [Lacipirellulaceae bacterium]
MANHAFGNDQDQLNPGQFNASQLNPDELLSAYLDGEVTPAERAAVEERLRSDPTARRLLESLTGVVELCRAEPLTRISTDLSAAVLAEASRRRAAERDSRPLEPTGDFGLPFGRSARSWVWAGVAAAAAIMIGFFGRTDRPTSRLEQGLAQMQEAVPGLRVVRLDVTPEGRQALERALKQHGIALAASGAQPMPTELGRFVEPVASPEADDDQLVMVSAEAPRMREVLSELERDDQVFRVEADRSLDYASDAAGPSAVGARGVGVPIGATPAPAGFPVGQAIRIQLRFTPGVRQTAPQNAPPANVVRAAPAGVTGPAPVVFVLRVRPQQ